MRLWERAGFLRAQVPCLRAAYRHIEGLKIQVSEREKAEAEVRELARGLEAKIRRLFEANVVGIVM